VIAKRGFLRRAVLLTPVFLSVALCAGCSSGPGAGNAGATGSGGGSQVGAGPVSVTVTPSSATVSTGHSQQFTAAVNPAGNYSLQWYVNGQYGGAAETGTISQSGLYTAPKIPPRPNTIKVTATCLCGMQTVSADVQVQLMPGATDFSALPDQIRTNLTAFFVSGVATTGETVTVNGTAATLDGAGNFVISVPLLVGANRIELDVQSTQSPPISIVKTVTLDPAFSTSGKRLLYVSSVSPTLPGTLVVDVDNNVFLGYIPNKYIRGISPDGRQIYMHDLSVLSTATHQELQAPASPLAFSQYIPSDGFLVSPDGARLYSRDEVLDLATNSVLPTKLPVNIETGYSFAGPNQGGPAITPDGKYIYCLGYGCEGFDGLVKINTTDNSITNTGINPFAYGAYLSDIAVSPDGRSIFLTTYGCCYPGAQVYDAGSFKGLFTSAIFLGDFAGDIAVSSDGSKVVFGSAGNPAYQGGAVTIVDVASWTTKTSISVDLADHIAISSHDEVFVSSGDTPGVLMFALNTDGTLSLQRQFALGINQFISSFGAPRNDDIEKLVFKP